MTIRRMSLAAGLVLAAVGCHDDELFPTAVPQYAGGAMFQRYVSLGNSITAGFPSGGVNDSAQRQAYAGERSGAPGRFPVHRPSLALSRPPPPVATPFSAPV